MLFKGLNKPRLRALVILAVGFAWMAAVVGNYYFQLWKLLIEGNWPGPIFHGDTSLPFIQDALLRALTGMAAAGVLMGSAALLGGVIFRFFGVHFERWSERLIFATSLGIGSYSFFGLGMAAVGLYRPGLLAFVGVAPALLWTGNRLLMTKKLAGFSLEGFKKNLNDNKIWIGLTFLAFGFSFVAALAPEREYDALWYHLYYPRLYLEQGRLVDLVYDYVSLYPMTWELWFGYGLSLGGQTGAKLLHFCMLPMTGMIVYEMARRFGYGASPWLSLAIFATVPTVLWEASTAYIDLALAFHTSLFVYAFLNFCKSRSRLWFCLTAFNLGMAVATKHLALFVVLIGFFGLFIYLWKEDRSFISAFGHAVVLAGLGLLAALPWYARAFWATGNPVFPEFYGIFGAPLDRWDAVTRAGLQQFLDQFGRPRTIANLLTLPWHMTIHGALYHGAIGPVLLVFTPFLFLRRLRGPLLWLIGFSMFFLLLWASPFSSLQMRFLVPLTPILAILAAEGFSRLSGEARAGLGRRGPNLLSAALVVLLVMNLPPFTFLHERDRVGWDGWLNHVLHGVEFGVVFGAESQHDYLNRKVRSYGVWTYAENHLPDEAVVLTWTGGDQFYTKKKRIWVYSTVARPAVSADPGDKDVIITELQALGITHMITDHEYRSRLDASYSGTPGWLEILYEDYNYTLYRVLR